LLPFFDALSGGSFYPFPCYPGAPGGVRSIRLRDRCRERFGSRSWRLRRSDSATLWAWDRILTCCWRIVISSIVPQDSPCLASSRRFQRSYYEESMNPAFSRKRFALLCHYRTERVSLHQDHVTRFPFLETWLPMWESYYPARGFTSVRRRSIPCHAIQQLP
jgi:hypothetical protein